MRKKMLPLLFFVRSLVFLLVGFGLICVFVRSKYFHKDKNRLARICLDSLIYSTTEHMCKFKGRSSMKQHIKNRPIKWGFRYWCRCDSETGYVYQLE